MIEVTEKDLRQRKGNLLAPIDSIVPVPNVLFYDQVIKKLENNNTDFKLELEVRI